MSKPQEEEEIEEVWRLCKNNAKLIKELTRAALRRIRQITDDGGVLGFGWR
jgi:hypothetical protein